MLKTMLDIDTGHWGLYFLNKECYEGFMTAIVTLKRREYSWLVFSKFLFEKSCLFNKEIEQIGRPVNHKIGTGV